MGNVVLIETLLYRLVFPSRRPGMVHASPERPSRGPLLWHTAGVVNQESVPPVSISGPAEPT